MEVLHRCQTVVMGHPSRGHVLRQYVLRLKVASQAGPFQVRNPCITSIWTEIIWKLLESCDLEGWSCPHLFPLAFPCQEFQHGTKFSFFQYSADPSRERPCVFQCCAFTWWALGGSGRPWQSGALWKMSVRLQRILHFARHSSWGRILNSLSFPL